MGDVRNATGFWMHHLVVAGTAFLVVALSRSIGLFGEVEKILFTVSQTAILVLVALPFQAAGARVAMLFAGERLGMPASACCGCVLAAIPSTAVAMSVMWLAGVAGSAGEPGATRADYFGWILEYFLPALFLHVTLGTILWMRLSYAWWHARLAEGNPKSSETGDDETTVRPVLRRETPPRMLRTDKTAGAELWALSSERHYVRVVTSEGADLVLTRFADAMEQCRDLDGVQIHRSHWVHTQGIARLERQGGRVRVVIRDDTVLPVSRGHQSDAIAFFASRGLDLS